MPTLSRPFVTLLPALALATPSAYSQAAREEGNLPAPRIGVPASAERLFTELKYVVERTPPAGAATTRTHYVQVMMSKVGAKAFVFPTYLLEAATLDGRSFFEKDCGTASPAVGPGRLRLSLLDTMLDADKREHIVSTLADSEFTSVEEPNFTATSWSATLRIQSHDADSVVATGWFKRSGRRLSVELQVPDVSVFADRTSQDLLLELGNTYTAYYEDDVLRGSYSINVKAINRLRNNLSGRPGTPTDYLVVLGGEVEQNRRLEAQIMQALEVSVRTPQHRPADPELVEKMLRDALEASRQQLELAKLDRQKFVTVILDDLVQITVPLGQLTSVTNKLRKDITDHRTDVLEKLRKGSAEVSGAGSISLGPIAGALSGSVDADHEALDKSHIERLSKLLDEIDRTAEGKVPYATGISFAQMLDDKLASTATGHISIGSFQYENAAYVFPLSFGGFCAPASGKYDVAELVIASTTLDKDTHWVAERIVIPAGTVITIPYGHSLTIEAGTLIVGGHVQIVGSGQRGAPGAPGVWPGQWDTSELRAWQDSCAAESDRGGAGGQGQPGFNGARVQIVYAALQGDLDNIDDDGLRAGPGGAGGGGSGGRLCRGPDKTAHQKYGPGGHAGPPGARGVDGSLRIKRQ